MKSCNVVVCIALMLGSLNGIFAQEMQPRQRLSSLVRERSDFHSSQLEKARAYAREHSVPMIFRDTRGNYIHLVGVDDFGLPVYLTTFNAGAATTTGVPDLRSGGALGLNLEGEGITVGIWDNDLVKDHSEFRDRLITRQGTTISDHSTHVTGTIIARGNDVGAKGMAPKARASTWDFLNDDSEMASLAKPDQTSLLFSNHSYGIVLGFFNDENAWSWAGNSSISTLEDYRFGFYSSKSRTLDQIAFNAPYYSIVWAAGNDRSDAGDNSHPPDGNQGSGFDSIGPEGVAKNNLTVGAVLKVTNYTSPASVVMTNFSSWGPTDDGRIKPDLVAAGVSVYSTSVNSSNGDSYSFQQGTSMSAPNATGSLMLLQELYRDLHAGNFMKAATLKALAIHTTKEAGLNPGPDYSFGWGLLDVSAAAKLLLAQDQESVVLLENTLQNEDVFEYDFEPLQNTKVTATIVWTDPPGSPVSPQLDPLTRMLVNDLDIRIVDAGGNQVLPWILNPNNPSAPATKNDNVRDNVEKIEFDLPEPRLYTLRVSHKGQLVNGSQDYSVIFTFTPLNDPKTALYWIGNGGNWNNPANWSLTSGGAPAGQVPDINTRVVVDENSFSSANQTIALTADQACASVTWLTKTAAGISLNNNTLTIDGNFVVSSNQMLVPTAGELLLVGQTSSQNQFSLNGNNFSSVDLVIRSANEAQWTVNGNLVVKSITLEEGGLIARGINVNTGKLNAITGNPKVLDISNSNFSQVNESVFNGGSLDLTSTGTSIKLVNSGSTIVTWSGVDFDGTLDAQGSQLTLSGGAILADFVAAGTLTLFGNNTFEKFNALPGVALSLQSGSIQKLSSNTLLSGSPGDRISVNTVGAGTAMFDFGGHFKLCFDYIDVSNVNIDNQVTVSAGSNSTLTNAGNWIPGPCSDALFADFSFKFNCEGALTEFTNLSDGDITSYTWNFGDPTSGQNASDELNPLHIFNNATTYTVTLTVSDGVVSESYSRQVTIGPNNIPENDVIIANEKLFSRETAEFYQWFKNGEVLANETGRWYEFDGDPGSYFVVIKDANCNLPSSVFLISAVEGEELDLPTRIKVFPNPADDKVNVELPQENLPVRISLINPLGQVIFSEMVDEPYSVIDTRLFGEGLYILELSNRQRIYKKILIQR